MEAALRELSETVAGLQGRDQIFPRLDAVLSPLAQYDARTGSDLVHTLQTYVEHGGALAETGETLFLHRNSVLYRLHRIKELSGIDAHDRATRLTLLVAWALSDASVLRQNAARSSLRPRSGQAHGSG